MFKRAPLSPIWCFHRQNVSAFTGVLINLNLKPQGRTANITVHYDAIRAFMEKIQLWKCQLQAGNFLSFLHLIKLLDEKEDLDQHYLDKEKQSR
jgi:hypothetical protein